MDWSVCTGCCLRHARYVIEEGQEIDDDSGLFHYGHFTCNVLFLAYYADNYPEGDDRPPRYDA